MSDTDVLAEDGSQTVAKRARVAENTVIGSVASVEVDSRNSLVLVEVVQQTWVEQRSDIVDCTDSEQIEVEAWVVGTTRSVDRTWRAMDGMAVGCLRCERKQYRYGEHWSAHCKRSTKALAVAQMICVCQSLRQSVRPLLASV